MLRLQKTLATMMMILAVGFFALGPTTAQIAPAQVTSAGEVERENSDINKMFHKLGRGVANVLTGWLEIPKQTAQEWRRTDPFTGTILGVIKGCVWGIARTFAGFYEIISFPFPVPSNYEPIMEPEFVLPTVWGERLPLFRDEFQGTGGSAIDGAIDYGSARTQTTDQMERNY